MPKVSVVIPAYNSEPFIRQTVESVLAQTFADFELVISDHSSTDGTWEALQPYADDERVRLFRTPTGGGAPANWKAVTEAATGEYLKLVCGDDVVEPTLLAEQVAALDAHPEAVLVACRRRLIDGSGATVIGSRGLPNMVGPLDGRRAARESIIRGTNVFGEPGSVLFRRADLMATGGWDGTDGYVIDQATYCNVLMRGGFVGLPDALAAFRVNAESWSVALTAQQASQVVAFHHRFAAANPGLLSRLDLFRGDTMARAMAVARRLTYLWLGRSMRGR